METRSYDFCPVRFHAVTLSFPARFHVGSQSKEWLRFLLVSGSFPFVSGFYAHTQETGNEGFRLLKCAFLSHCPSAPPRSGEKLFNNSAWLRNHDAIPGDIAFL